MLDTVEASTFEESGTAQHKARSDGGELRSYYAAAQYRYESDASDTWLGRLWVWWKMQTYDPVVDKRVPAQVRHDLWWSSQ